ncbi:hypothetical protein AAC387_Pa09g0831 [Persea americana]
MAESSCNTSMAVTQEGPVDEIRQQTEVVAHVVIDVAAVNGNELVYLDPEWVNSMKGKISHEPRKIKASFSSCSISRIPPSLRHFDEKAYIPQIISIGPFHYEKRMGGLQAMEEHKWRYLRAAINRNGEDCLEQYLREIKNLEKRARETYTEEIDLDSNSFVEMMILDACFIIELFYRFSNRNKFDMADPILNLVLLPTIQSDLIMLENQIPFFILQHLFDLMNISGPPLAQMALNFFASLDTLHTMLMNYSINNSHLQFHHLLHLLHSKFIPSVENEDPKLKYLENMHSASELQEAGIKCKKGAQLRGVVFVNASGKPFSMNGTTHIKADNFKSLKDGAISMRSFATHDEEVSEVNLSKFVGSSVAAQGIVLYKFETIIEHTEL